MSPQTVYLSLGSNLGDRAQNLADAVTALRQAGVHVQKISSIYETEPVDYLTQPWFLNCSLQAQTQLAPLDLLRLAQQIEATMGREKPIPKGPRLIDIDILLYGDETIDTPELQIPHPRMLLRRFVLVPLAEIAPNLRHASWPAPAQALLARTPDQSAVRRWKPRSVL